MILSIDAKLNFGKYEGRSPREVFMGTNVVNLPWDVSDGVYKIVDKVYSETFGIEWRSEIVQDSVEKIKVRLPNDLNVGQIIKHVGLEDLRIVSPLDYFVFLVRGDVGYIQWLIENTEYYFNPVELDGLMQEEVFYPEVLIVSIGMIKNNVADKELHGVYWVEAIPNYIKPVIHARVIELNRLKFNKQAE